MANLERILDLVINNIQPQQRRILEDTEKRLDSLFEKLAAKQIKPKSVQNLVALSKALTLGDYHTSNGIIMSMLTTDDENWVLGVKRLVEMFIQIKVKVNYNEM
jgi:protein transport protein SEC31